MDEEYIEIKCLEVRQPIGVFYVGVIDYDDFKRISFGDIRRMLSRETDLETFIGIQRTIDIGRVNKIKKYLEGIDATFPTSMIISVSSENTEYDNVTHTMRIANKPDVAKILDGQHRIKGLNDYFKPGNQFQLNTTIFLDVELEEQALIFATINQSQTKVNNSLVADLYEFATIRSPQKTGHNICKALNEKSESPFKDKIKILGTADDKIKETITQSTFVDNVVMYISDDRVKDRNIYKVGEKPRKISIVESRRLIFRNLFIDERDGDIAKIIYNYFTAVKIKWENYWIDPAPNLILNKSTGFIALMKFLRPAYISIVGDNIGTVATVQDFIRIFDRIYLNGEDINRTRYSPGSSGISVFYKELLEKSGLS